MKAKSKTKTDGDGLADSTDPLIQADMLLAEGKLVDAAAKYSAVYADDKATFDRHLSAWAGLLDTDPLTALTACKALIETIVKNDAVTRTAQVRYIGWQLWRVGSREVSGPMKSIYCYPPTALPGKMLKDVPDGHAQACALVESLIAVDSLAIFSPDATRERSNLRFGFAFLYLLNGQPKEGGELAWRPQEETVPAPPGGWLTNNNLPEQGPGAKLPKLVKHPVKAELLTLTADLAQTAAASPTLENNASQFCGYVGMGIAKFLGKSGTLSDYDAKDYQAALGSLAVSAVKALPLVIGDADKDKIPDAFLPMEQMMMEVLKNKSIALGWATELSNVMLIPAVRAGRDASSKTAGLHITILLLDTKLKLGETAKNVSNVARLIAARMDLLKDPNLTEYSQRLLERYPAPQ